MRWVCLRHPGALLPLALCLTVIGCTSPSARNVPGPSALPADSGTVRSGSSVLGYVVNGSGRPCLVIGSRVLHPRTFSARWRRELRCAYLDDRIYAPGGRAEPGRRYDAELFVEDIEAARQALGLDRFVLVGHSIFGLVAMRYAQQYPERVTHVIALGSPPEWSPRAVEAAAAYWDRKASPGRKALDQRNRDALTPDSLAKLSPADAFVASYVAAAARYWADSTFDASPLWAGTAVHMDLLGQLLDVTRPMTLSSRPVDVPVFVALGRFDFVAPPTLWRDYPTPFRNLTVRVFDRAGHTPQMEDPAFDEEVLRWLRR